MNLSKNRINVHLWKVGSKDSGLEIVNIIKAKLFHLKQSDFTKFSIRFCCKFLIIQL